METGHRPWAYERPNIREKIQGLEGDLHRTLLAGFEPTLSPLWPARDVQILPTKQHPPKKGFSTREGSARMLHDLASIELQAMELGLRSMVEYPEAPREFRDALAALTLSEGEHLKLCLDALELLGYKWGDWPVHCNLWAAVSSEDTILDRLLIVHRYLEGSGLDAGHHIIQRLKGLLVSGVDTTSIDAARKALEVLEVINREEVGHVLFGSEWYRHFCRAHHLDPDHDFPARMKALYVRLPRRFEKLNHDLRRRAGFTDAEILFCEEIRDSYLQLGRGE